MSTSSFHAPGFMPAFLSSPRHLVLSACIYVCLVFVNASRMPIISRTRVGEMPRLQDPLTIASIAPGTKALCPSYYLQSCRRHPLQSEGVPSARFVYCGAEQCVLGTAFRPVVAECRHHSWSSFFSHFNSMSYSTLLT